VWKPKGSSDRQVFPQDTLPEFNALIGMQVHSFNRRVILNLIPEQLEGIHGVMLDEDVTNGILIASEKSDHHSVLHHLF
jgi:hypothetical protein